MLPDHLISTIATHPLVIKDGKEFLLLLELPKSDDQTENFYSYTDVDELQEVHRGNTSEMVRVALVKWRDETAGTVAQFREALTGSYFMELAHDVLP